MKWLRAAQHEITQTEFALVDLPHLRTDHFMSYLWDCLINNTLWWCAYLGQCEPFPEGLWKTGPECVTAVPSRGPAGLVHAGDTQVRLVSQEHVVAGLRTNAAATLMDAPIEFLKSMSQVTAPWWALVQLAWWQHFSIHCLQKFLNRFFFIISGFWFKNFCTFWMIDHLLPRTL